MRRQPLNSLATKIIFFVFLSTFLTALAVSWISIESTHAFLRQRIDRSFPAQLDRTSHRVAEWLDAAQAGVAHLAEAPALRAAAAGVGGDPALARRALDELLATRKGERPLFTGLVLLHPAGGWVARSDGAPDLSHDRVTGGQLTAAEGPALHAVRGDGGALHLLAIAPVRRGEPRGPVLAGVVDLRGLEGLLAADLDDAARRITVVDASGLRVAEAGAARGCDAADGAPLPDCASRGAGATGTVAIPPPPAQGRSVSDYQTPDGERMIGASRPIGALGWTLVVEEPFDRAFQPVLSVVTRIFVTDLAIILLFSFLAYKITSAIVHPIEALSEGARRISQGELDLEIPDTGSHDEIALLTRTFNDMTRKLRKNQTEIDGAIQQLQERKQELETANEQLAQLSITDGLTKLHNHRFFQDHLTREIKRVQRSGEPLSMLLVDIDDFKRLNDRLGHAAGDELLTRIARIMNDAMRESDLLARYGGEEFVVLTSSTDLAGAVVLAEKVRESVAECSFLLDETMRLEKVTVSVGVAQYKGDRKGFFQNADRALYRAKAQGKNCVRAEGDAVV